MGEIILREHFIKFKFKLYKMYQEDIEFIHSHQEFVELKKTID